MTKAIVTLEGYGDSRFKQWAKTVERVNKEESTGYAFIGDFVRIGSKVELEVGTHVMEFGNFGSRSNHLPSVRLSRVTFDGLKTVKEFDELNKKWALDVRDEIANIVHGQDNQKSDGPLSDIPTKDLLAELETRGFDVSDMKLQCI